MTLNPVTENNAQPFSVNQKVILEKRTPEGILDLTLPQPPLRVREVDGRGRGTLSRDLILNDVYKMMFKELDRCSHSTGVQSLTCNDACPDAQGSWTALRAWLDSKSWVIRAKTW